MKKLVVSFAFVLTIIYAGVSTVSAEAYEVQKGDSLWKIADKYDTTVDDLININELKTTVIQPKQELTIYETYIVEKGDTLSGIGKHFDVTVDDLKEWNELDTNLIVIDQELKVKTTNATKSEDKSEPSKSTEEKQASESNATEEKTTSAESNDNQAPEGKTMEVTATAYTANCAGCSGITATGVDLNANRNAKVIAVDPSVIPLGTKVYVEGYGYATAADTGGAINGNKIDIHVPTKDEAYSWGRRTVKVTIVE